jgi:hypothetical protein
MRHNERHHRRRDIENGDPMAFDQRRNGICAECVLHHVAPTHPGYRKDGVRVN